MRTYMFDKHFLFFQKKKHLEKLATLISPEISFIPQNVYERYERSNISLVNNLVSNFLSKVLCHFRPYYQSKSRNLLLISLTLSQKWQTKIGSNWNWLQLIDDQLILQIVMIIIIMCYKELFEKKISCQNVLTWIFFCQHLMMHLYLHN